MKLEIYIRRGDSRYGWRLIADNNKILANDAGQGYENRADCLSSAALVTVYPYRSIEVVDV